MKFTFDGREFDLTFVQADASKADRSRIVDAIANVYVEDSSAAPEDVAMMLSYEANRLVTGAAVYDPRRWRCRSDSRVCIRRTRTTS